MLRLSFFHCSNLNIILLHGRYFKSHLLSSERDTPPPPPPRFLHNVQSVWLRPPPAPTPQVVLNLRSEEHLHYWRVTTELPVWHGDAPQRLFTLAAPHVLSFIIHPVMGFLGELQKKAFTSLCFFPPRCVPKTCCVFLKRQYFFHGFLLAAKHKRNPIFACYLLIYLFVVSTVICAIGAWIMTRGSAVWFSADTMELVLPSLPCFFSPSSSSLLKCACLFQFVKLTRTSY